MGGKCADLNALYVGLARSVGLPARHVYGLRIAKSDLGYKSLGLATDKATRASTAARRYTFATTAGFRRTRQTYVKWFWKSLPGIVHSAMKWCRRHARACSAPGR